MKEALIELPDQPVNPISTILWAARVEAWAGIGVLVENTGSETVTVRIETRLADTGDYAPRPVDDLVDIAAGAAKQFDADSSLSMWFALVGTATGAGSTAKVSLLLSRGGRPW
jgi:hypothetical protein